MREINFLKILKNNRLKNGCFLHRDNAFGLSKIQYLLQYFIHIFAQNALSILKLNSQPINGAAASSNTFLIFPLLSSFNAGLINFVEFNSSASQNVKLNPTYLRFQIETWKNFWRSLRWFVEITIFWNLFLNPFLVFIFIYPLPFFIS